MAEVRLADKMLRRSHDAPMSRRKSIDLLFIMQRHAVFSIDPDSADHISDIVFAQHDTEELNHIKKYELMNDYHDGYEDKHPERREKPRPAPKLRRAMHEARQKWAEILRDEDLVDVRVTVNPSEEADFVHIYPLVNLKVSAPTFPA